MKIAIFTDNFYPELGGIQDSIEPLSQELSKMGHEVAFFVPKYSVKNYQRAGREIKELDLGKDIFIKRFFSFPWPSPTLQSRFVMPCPTHWLRVKKFKPDVIHTQTFFGLGLDALACARLYKIPTVGTNHMALAAFNAYVPVKIDWFVGYARWYYNQCDFITAPSSSAFRDMVEEKVTRPHQVLSNPIDVKNFIPADAETSARLKRELKVSNHTLVFAGRLAAEKNIDVIVQAVALVKEIFPDINLALAGHGQDENNLKKLAARLGIEKNIKFFGFMNKRELAKLYQASDIFVSTSESETQGMTVLQAMACAKPVIGANARSLPEYINSQNGILVEPGDYQTLSKRIIELFKDPARMDKLGRGGLEQVQAYSPENIAKAWLEIYQKTIDLKYNS